MDNNVVREGVEYAYKHSEPFRRRMDEAGLSPEDIREVDDLYKIPVLKKDKVVVMQRLHPPFGGLVATGIESLARVFISPGPIFDPQGEKEDFWRWKEALEAAGFVKGDIVINTFSYHLTPAGFMFDSGLRALGAVVVPTGVGNTEEQVRVMKQLEVTGYVGTPSFLYNILQRAKSLECHPGSLSLKKAFVSAEMLPESLRREFEEEWGIATFQGYGTADLGAVAYECKEKKGMHISTGVIVQICDPLTGEPVPEGTAGEVVVTLFDPVYPLIRFGTGDLSAMTSEPCPCGCSSPKLVRIMGRVGSSVKVRGMFVHAYQIKELVDQHPGIERIQCVITRKDQRDVLTMRVAATKPFSLEEVEEFSKHAREKIKVKVDRVEFVPAGSLDGKLLFDDQRAWD
jgi:phenylacetate-CoA ligase